MSSGLLSTYLSIYLLIYCSGVVDGEGITLNGGRVATRRARCTMVGTIQRGERGGFWCEKVSAVGYSGRGGHGVDVAYIDFSYTT